MEHAARSVVDVHEHRVIPARCLRTEAGTLRDHREEIPVDQVASRICGELAREREQMALVPLDDHIQRFDHVHRAHSGVLQDRSCRVAEPEPAYDDIEVATDNFCEREAGEVDLGNREQARHEELIAELHFVHIDLERRFQSSPHADLTNRCLTPVDLLEP